ncbi:MAG: hypothetical protein ACKVWR_17560 [Acidimicrobiales bacterium]
MYAHARERTATIPTARAQDESGRPLPLTMPQIAGTDDPLIAVSALRRAIEAGRAGELCAEIAARAPAAALVEVVDERHDLVERAAGRPSLLERTVHARCPAR